MNIMYVSNDIGMVASLFQNAKVQLGNKTMTNTNTNATASILNKSTATQETSDNSGKQVQKILNKFRAGHKLSSAELQYLKQYAPDMYEKVVRIQQQREELEQEVKKADTKSEAQDIVNTRISMSLNGCEEGDEFTSDAINNQFRAALKEFDNTGKTEDTSEQEMAVEKGTAVGVLEKELEKGIESPETAEDTQQVSESASEDDLWNIIKNPVMYTTDGELKDEQKEYKGNRINFAV